MKARENLQPEENEIDPYFSLVKSIDFNKEYSIPDCIYKEALKNESMCE